MCEDGIGQFEEGDRVRHYGEGVEGEVCCTSYPTPKFLVEWEDGYESLESFHTVERLEASGKQSTEVDQND